MSPSDYSFYQLEVLLISLLVAGLLVMGLLRALRRRRPGMAIGHAIATAFAIRIAIAGALDAAPGARSLRGGDEETFLWFANHLRDSPLGLSAWLDSFQHKLHEFVFAVQLRLFDSPDLGLRITQVAIAVTGITLLATAVYDLAGPRAGRIAAWLLALEPTNVFFSGLIHKESLMLLAAGLVAYGGAGLWTRASLTSLLPMAMGGAVAYATRQYAGLFLVAAASAITLHASFRTPARQSLAGVTLLVVAVLLVGGAGPSVLAGSDEQLERLQVSQDANATDDSNLSLERVDVSTPTSAIRNLPIRVRDILLRPYPWEVENASQRLGLIGTTFLLVGMGFLIAAVARARGAMFRWAGPLIYLLAFQVAAYALAAGNAGTAFRYRTHLVATGICLVVVLRERYRQEMAAPAPEPVAPPARELAWAR
jgi:hypothetical protein